MPASLSNSTAPPAPTKLRLVYLPFLCYGIALIAVYTFLNRLFLVRQDIIHLDESIRIKWLPLALCWLPFFIWYMPRAELLAFKTNARIPVRIQITGLVIIASLSMAAPLLLTQQYFTATTERLAVLDGIKDIARHKTAESFTIKNYYIDKEYLRTYLKKETGGMSGQRLDLSLFIACPVYDHWQPVDSTRAAANAGNFSLYPFAWIGATYNRRIGGRLNASRQQDEIQAFSKASLRDFAQQPATGFSYFDNLPDGKHYAGFKEAVKGADRFAAGMRLLLLQPRRTAFKDTSSMQALRIATSLAIGAAIYLLIISFIPLDNKKVSDWLMAKERRKKQGHADWRRLFVPGKAYMATPILLYLNLAVFAAMVATRLGFFEFSGKDLAQWGGNYGPYIAHAQWWRLLTSMFLNEGATHLVFNMYALIFTGIVLESIMGSWRFTACFLVTGIIGGFIIYKMYPTDVVIVSCSGAIFGMYGLLIALLLTGVLPAAFKQGFLTSAFLFICFNLWRGYSGDIDNVAHVGGLIAGLALGFIPGVAPRSFFRKYRG